MSKQEKFSSQASEIAARLGGGENEIALTTAEVAAALRTSKTWLEILRGKGGGPKFLKLGPSIVRYRRTDILDWLDTLTYQSTAGFPQPPHQKGNMYGRRGKPRKAGN